MTQSRAAAIGILGGTFDPVHNAHLAMARAALSYLALDQVLWIPTGAPGYRRPPVASAGHRVAMLELALALEPRYAIDERELAPGASGYTVDTLAALRAERPQADWFLLLGADQYASFETWHRPREVERLARLAVFSRPGFEPSKAGPMTVPMEPMAISASDLRARIARGESVVHLVPPSVANYIAAHGLYR